MGQNWCLSEKSPFWKYLDPEFSKPHSGQHNKCTGVYMSSSQNTAEQRLINKSSLLHDDWYIGKFTCLPWALTFAFRVGSSACNPEVIGCDTIIIISGYQAPSLQHGMVSQLTYVEILNSIWNWNEVEVFACLTKGQKGKKVMLSYKMLFRQPLNVQVVIRVPIYFICIWLL